MPRVTISEPGKTPQPYRFQLERPTINIGRGSDNDIIIECGSCSTDHCVMQRVKGGYILKDTHSTNGIKHDDVLMDIIDLYDGMEVLVGNVSLEFRLSDEELATLSEEKFRSHERKALPSTDEDVIEEEHHPDTSSPPASHPRHSQDSPQKGNDAIKSLIVLILMIVAIGIGMTLRHYKETGEFLPSKFLQSSTDTEQL